MDRFARRLRTALECLERLGPARVGVVSVSEPNLDYSTPQGFLFLSMLGRWPSGTAATFRPRSRRATPSASAGGCTAAASPSGR
jgi:site-specific DNA recombinase